MTSGGGAIVAIAAAARQRRMQEIVDAFRLADATSPERAVTCAALGVDSGQFELVDLVRDGVLAPGAGADTLYLNEGAYIALRGARSDRRKLVLLSLLLMVVVLLGLGYFKRMSFP